MRGIATKLLIGAGALALMGTAPALAADECAMGTLETAGLCLEPIQDDTLLSVSGTGQLGDPAQYENGGPAETAVILWDEFQKPRVSGGNTRVSQSMTLTETGVRLNLSELAGDF